MEACVVSWVEAGPSPPGRYTTPFPPEAFRLLLGSGRESGRGSYRESDRVSSRRSGRGSHRGSDHGSGLESERRNAVEVEDEAGEERVSTEEVGNISCWGKAARCVAAAVSDDVDDGEGAAGERDAVIGGG